MCSFAGFIPGRIEKAKGPTQNFCEAGRQLPSRVICWKRSELGKRYGIFIGLDPAALQIYPLSSVGSRCNCLSVESIRNNPDFLLSRVLPPLPPFYISYDVFKISFLSQGPSLLCPIFSIPFPVLTPADVRRGLKSNSGFLPPRHIQPRLQPSRGRFAQSVARLQCPCFKTNLPGVEIQAT